MPTPERKPPKPGKYNVGSASIIELLGTFVLMVGPVLVASILTLIGGGLSSDDATTPIGVLGVLALLLASVKISVDLTADANGWSDDVLKKVDRLGFHVRSGAFGLTVAAGFVALARTGNDWWAAGGTIGALVVGIVGVAGFILVMQDA